MLNYKEYFNLLRGGALPGALLFDGEEEYIKDSALAQLRAKLLPEGLEELTHIVDLQEFYFSKGDAEHLRQVDDRFHDAICTLSKRNVIMDTLIPLHRKTRRYRRLSMEDWSRTTNTKREHYEIYQAMASGNAELAQELTAQHITNAKNHMLERMKNNG